jgi:hypothetical protein
MTDDPGDQMWEEFRPLWDALCVAGGNLLLAGGYGLFLKQHWLFANRSEPTIIPPDQWGDKTARVTKDLDFIVGLDLIASTTAQAHLIDALSNCGYIVAHEHPRWQFAKNLQGGKRILVDLHAEVPMSASLNLALDKLRVKHKPSLGAGGIHGRQNAEAAGCEHHPFRFEIGGIDIGVPNPITWAVMKLVAMRDQRLRSDDVKREQRHRDFHRQQAIKHAHDVCRIVAMTTRDEVQYLPGVVAAIRNQHCFDDAVQINAAAFQIPEGWAAQVVRASWRQDDLEMILSTLTNWFQ